VGFRVSFAVYVLGFSCPLVVTVESPAINLCKRNADYSRRVHDINTARPKEVGTASLTFEGKAQIHSIDYEGFVASNSGG